MTKRVITECEHKDRPYWAKGMCKFCYDRKWRTRRMSQCHPERFEFGKGMCCACYHDHKKSKLARAKCHPNLPENKVGTGECDNCFRIRTKYRARILYNLSLEQYNDLLKRQNNCCALCKLPFGNEAPRVDHDHRCCPGKKSCGKCVRGLLHNNCNRVLGFLKDDVVLLKLAVQYLESGGDSL